MTVTHNVTLIVNGKTISMQSDLAFGSTALSKMDTDELTMGEQESAVFLLKCLGRVGNDFGAIITSLAVAVIP